MAWDNLNAFIRLGPLPQCTHQLSSAASCELVGSVELSTTTRELDLESDIGLLPSMSLLCPPAVCGLPDHTSSTYIPRILSYLPLAKLF